VREVTSAPGTGAPSLAITWPRIVAPGTSTKSTTSGAAATRNHLLPFV
jgi:hypothetical protein